MGRPGGLPYQEWQVWRPASLPNGVLVPLAGHHLDVLSDSRDTRVVGAAAVREGVVPDDEVPGAAVYGGRAECGEVLGAGSAPCGRVFIQDSILHGSRDTGERAMVGAV